MKSPWFWQLTSFRQFFAPNRSHLRLKALSLACVIVLILQYFYIDHRKYLNVWNNPTGDLFDHRLDLLNRSVFKSDQSKIHQATILATLATSDVATMTNDMNVTIISTSYSSTKFDLTTTSRILPNETCLNDTTLDNDVNNSTDKININESTKFMGAKDGLDVCPLTPPVLVGPIKVWFDYPAWPELHQLYPDIEPGGHGKPSSCVSRNRVAIILPYRDREQQLRTFLHNLHSLLTKQQLDYAIFVVEQISNQTFNRGKLMNVGFAEAMKIYDWQCFIFHDVDLLPEDDRNLYTCPEQPRHMSVAVDKFGYNLPYSDIFGGISALTKQQFLTLNGFSNDYWGWGGEDDDMASRVKIHQFTISRYSANIARYKMIKHAQEKSNPVNTCRYNLMYKVHKRWKNDGISTLRYELKARELQPLVTWLFVDLLESESKARLYQEKICK